jgi:hypothetical protein
MRMVKAAFLGLAFASSLAIAAHADDESRLALARDLVKETHANDNARLLMPAIANQMKPMLARQGLDQKLIDDFTSRLLAKLNGDLDKFGDLAAQVYAKEFSEQDLANLLAFYKTPTGQNLIAKQPIISQGMATAGIQWGQVLAREVLQDIQNDKAKKRSSPDRRLPARCVKGLRRLSIARRHPRHSLPSPGGA